MRNRLGLTLFCLAVVAGCRPRVDGAPCSSNDNCPRGQYCAEGFCAEGTGPMGGGGGSMATGGGNVTGGGQGGGGGGHGLSDGGASSSREITAASGRMQGGTLTLDLQVGHPTPRTTMTGGTLELTGASAVQH